MGWFSHKCPKCGGELESTGYSAPYPSHRCRACIAANTAKSEINDLRKRIARIEADYINQEDV